VVGACGIRVNQAREFIGEIGYFVDENCWGLGIATRAVRLLEALAFRRLKLKRIEILMRPENKASERVAIKAGYRKEGTLKKCVQHGKSYYDAHLYAKVV
jgi:[ribosomal protein S5]-alanine N-acetyltransferase